MTVSEHLELAECECEAGDLTLVVRERKLCGLVFSDHWHWLDHWLMRRFGEVKIARTKDPARVVTHMRAYLAGELDALDAIDVDTGGTEFQQQVWAMLRKIAKPGKTITYGELARAVGAPKRLTRGGRRERTESHLDRDSLSPRNRLDRRAHRLRRRDAAQGMAAEPRRRAASGDARQPAVLKARRDSYGVAVLRDSASIVSTSVNSGTPASAPSRVQLTAAAAFANRSTCSVGHPCR
jgi:O6-methylguanine-DNA--protein-cysteine methyltransferase